MKTKLSTLMAMLSLVVSTNAQITKHLKYDWGWSYKLEMPETGLRCEFPEKPIATTLAYGWMAAASHKDELYVVAKMENADPFDISCTTNEFLKELQKVYHLPVSNIEWGPMHTENGHLTISADSKKGYAQFHIDAIATKDILTIFLYSDRNGLSVPGYFFARSYSVYDMPEGEFVYLAKAGMKKRARVMESDKDRSVIKLENSPIRMEWPDVPQLEVSRNEASYSLSKDGSSYATRVIALNPQMSYTYFNTLVNREHLKMSEHSTQELLEDESEVSVQPDQQGEVYFRKMAYRSESGTKHRFYMATNNMVIVQELEVSKELGPAEMRFLNTFEQSVHNQYDNKALVSK
jgi:hypothetical protein